MTPRPDQPPPAHWDFAAGRAAAARDYDAADRRAALLERAAFASWLVVAFAAGGFVATLFLRCLAGAL